MRGRLNVKLNFFGVILWHLCVEPALKLSRNDLWPEVWIIGLVKQAALPENKSTNLVLSRKIYFTKTSV